MKKQITAMLSVLCLVWSLCGCGAGTAESTQAPISAPESTPTAVQETEAPVPVAEAAPSTLEDSALPEERVLGEPAQELDMESIFAAGWDESSVSEMYAEVKDKFEQREYTDAETGLTIPYNLYIPQEIGDEKVPMVVFISDSTSVGQDLTAPLTQGYGGIIWATDTEQEKHKSYVLVPEYPEIIIDDNHGTTVTDYVDATARMIEAVAGENAVDTDRIYGTGQSMGCMTFLYLAANYPDLLAAELFVSGQWQLEELPELHTQTFFYIAAGGDPKASEGQANVLSDLEAKQIPVSTSYEWDATWTDADYEAVLRPMLEEGNAINIGQFAAGTVLEANPRGIEHMSSFDCAYRIDAVRNWLFMQHK